MKTKKKYYKNLLLLIGFLFLTLNDFEAQSWISNLGASCYTGSQSNIYLIKQGDYANYNLTNESLNSRGTLSANWPGLTSFWQSDLDAATYINSDREIYLFKGNKYARYDLDTETITSEATIATGWSGLTDSFWHSDLDAATYFNSDREIYLFKGNKYLRYDLATETITSEATIATGWSGLTDSFWHSDLDAATYFNTNREIYLFKGSKYLRYNIDTETKTSGGSILCGWPGLFSKPDNYSNSGQQEPRNDYGVHSAIDNTPNSQLSRHDILAKYAPIFLQGVSQETFATHGEDLILAVDHDRNWQTWYSGTDNSDIDWDGGTDAGDAATWMENKSDNNYDEDEMSDSHSHMNDRTPVVYSSMYETNSYYILKYSVYHAYNNVPLGLHKNDLESLILTVNKNDSKVELFVATQHAHKKVYKAEHYNGFPSPDNLILNRNTVKFNGNHPILVIGGNGSANPYNALMVIPY